METVQRVQRKRSNVVYTKRGLKDDKRVIRDLRIWDAEEMK